jgi:hypothetical protein
VPTVTRLFHYDTFKARMALPATHKDFPNVAVLHGICAASARYTARVFTCNPEDEPWLRAGEHVEDPQREEDFGIRHQLFAWQAINTQLNRGVRIYESAQALILLANHHHMYARWAEGWVCIGLAARLMPPLGLGMRERANAGTGPAGKGPFLSPSLNGIEREERRALFWASVLYDVQISASSGWAGILQQDEIVGDVLAWTVCLETSLTLLVFTHSSYRCQLAWKLLRLVLPKTFQKVIKRCTARICGPGQSIMRSYKKESTLRPVLQTGILLVTVSSSTSRPCACFIVSTNLYDFLKPNVAWEVQRST